MREFLVTIGSLLALVSVVAFFIGVIFLFFKDKREVGLKILLYAVIGFVIGFGTCTVNFSLNMQ